MNGNRKQQSLDEYFARHFAACEPECEWLTDASDGSWRFEIPSRKLAVRLTANEDGSITETRSVPRGAVLTTGFLEELWDAFGDIPMNPETEEIEDWFYIWPPGTWREEIWHWFDARYPDGVYDLLYGAKEGRL